MELIDKLLAWWNSTPTITFNIDTNGDLVVFLIFIIVGWGVVNVLLDYLLC